MVTAPAALPCGGNLPLAAGQGPEAAGAAAVKQSRFYSSGSAAERSQTSLSGFPLSLGCFLLCNCIFLY